MINDNEYKAAKAWKDKHDPEKKTCLWTLEDNVDITLWGTECGEQFYIEGCETPTEKNMTFCCFCGKELIEDQ